MITAPRDTVGAFVGEPAVLVRGRRGGPLCGVTVGVKDVFDVAGTITRAGNPAFAEGRAPAVRSAGAVERLVGAGATVVGRTVSDALAFSLSGTNRHDGTPVNVAAPGRVPGGSSAGAAAAVAAGLIDLGLATDTGGSIRVPASYCGVVGWRPTHGRVTTSGLVPLAPSFDTVGLLGACPNLVRDAADVLLADGDTAASGGRVVVLEETLSALRPEVAEAFGRACDLLGAEATVSIGVDLDEALTAFRTLQGWEAWKVHGEWIRARRPDLGAGIAARFEAASRIAKHQLAPADEVRRRVADAMAGATRRGEVLLVPAAAGAAPPLERNAAEHEDDRMRTLRVGCLAALAGAPAVALPVGRIDGLPFGVAAVGAPGSDRSLLRWAADVMAALAAEVDAATQVERHSREGGRR